MVSFKLIVYNFMLLTSIAAGQYYRCCIFFYGYPSCRIFREKIFNSCYEIQIQPSKYSYSNLIKCGNSLKQTLDLCDNTMFKCLRPIYSREISCFFQCSLNRPCPKNYVCCYNNCFGVKICQKAASTATSSTENSFTSTSETSVSTVSTSTAMIPEPTPASFTNLDISSSTSESSTLLTSSTSSTPFTTTIAPLTTLLVTVSRCIL